MNVRYFKVLLSFKQEQYISMIRLPTEQPKFSTDEVLLDDLLL